MSILSQDVVTPIHEKQNICPYCLKKLSILQRYQKKKTGQVECKECGGIIRNVKRGIKY